MSTTNWNHIVRRANIADGTALTALISEPLNGTKSGAFIDGLQQVDDSEDATTHAELLDGDIVTLVAESNQVLQGFVQVRWNVRPPAADWMRRSVELRRHYVRVRYRGAGVAAGLLESAIELARVKDATGVWLKVGKESRQAVGFYQKHGFQIAGSSMAMEGTRCRERWVMHRALRAPAKNRPLAFGGSAVASCGN